MGGRGYGGGGRGRLYTYRYTVTTRMTCIKMGNDESHFNVSLIVRDKVTRQCPQTTTFLKRKESRSGIEPRSFRLPAYRLTASPNRFWLGQNIPRRAGRTMGASEDSTILIFFLHGTLSPLKLYGLLGTRGWGGEWDGQ